MKTLKIQHIMDETARDLTLNEAFLEALQLSEGKASDIEEQEYALYEYLIQYPEFIKHISDDYKRNILEAWDYEIIKEN